MSTLTGVLHGVRSFSSTGFVQPPGHNGRLCKVASFNDTSDRASVDLESCNGNETREKGSSMEFQRMQSRELHGGYE